MESAGGAPLPVAPSQGENQILGLAFIGTIISFQKKHARKYASQQDPLYRPEAIEYPVVMDSPFGSLDSIYRGQIAKHIPQLADQVILLATMTQWRGEVEREMADRTGRSYVLSYHTPRLDIGQVNIELHGTTYPLVRPSLNEFEYTEVVEVTCG